MSVDVSGWVLRHSPTTGTDRLVLLVLADAADSDGTNAWPSLDTIAQRANVNRRTAQRSLRRLDDDGHIAIESNVGGPVDARADRRPNRYTVLMRGGARTAPSDETGRRTDRPAGDHGAALATSRGGPDDTNGAAHGPPYPSLVPVQRHPSGKHTPGARTNDPDDDPDLDGFDEFWSVCPRRVGKGAARKAYAKRIRAGVDPDELIGGMERYARWVEVTRTETRFVCHPSTWLNQEREKDELDFHPPRDRLSPGERSMLNTIERREEDHHGAGNGGRVRPRSVRRLQP